MTFEFSRMSESEEALTASLSFKSLEYFVWSLLFNARMSLLRSTVGASTNQMQIQSLNTSKIKILLWPCGLANLKWSIQHLPLLKSYVIPECKEKWPCPPSSTEWQRKMFWPVKSHTSLMSVNSKPTTPWKTRFIKQKMQYPLWTKIGFIAFTGLNFKLHTQATIEYSRCLVHVHALRPAINALRGNAG